MIRAKTYSDDHAVEVNFDATPWFDQALPQDILDLADCGWGGDYPADHVAEYFEADISAIEKMFDYVRATQSTRNAQGFECYIDEDDAKAWLDLYRPGWNLNDRELDKGRVTSKTCQRCGAVSASGRYCPRGCGRI